MGAWRAATAAMAAGIVGIAIYAGQMSDRMRRANEEHQQQLAAMNSRIAGLDAELKTARVEVATLQHVLGDRLRLEKVLSAPDLRLTALRRWHRLREPMRSWRSAPPTKLPRSRLPVCSRHRLARLTSCGGSPRSMGRSRLDCSGRGRPSGGRSRSALPPPGEHVLLSAVTLEPAGGVSKPTGAMYLKGAPAPA